MNYFDLSYSFCSQDFCYFCSNISKGLSQEDSLGISFENFPFKHKSNFDFFTNYDNTSKGLSNESKEKFKSENKEENKNISLYNCYLSKISNFEGQRLSKSDPDESFAPNFIEIKREKEKSYEKNNFIGKKKTRFKTEKLKEKIFSDGKFDTYSEEIYNEVKNLKIDNSKKKENNDIIENKNINVSKKKRKYCTDEIRTKFMSKFFKSFKNRLNEILEYFNSKEFFNCLSQKYIKNFTSEILQAKNENNFAENDLTFEEIISEKSKIVKLRNKDSKKVKLRNKDSKKVKLRNKDSKKNLSVLKYLKDNKNISEKLSFNDLKNKKFSDIFDEYLDSMEFKRDISALKFQKNEDDEYIKKYIKKSFDFIGKK